MEGKRDNIILIGFMGSGKSTTGIGLSYRLQCPVSDTDKMIEKSEGKGIPEIFAESGEAYFREKETELLQSLTAGKARQIYSVGGGTPLREENRRLLGELGTVVWLKVSPHTVWERLQGDTSRPLLQGDDPLGRITALLGEREDLYAEAADIAVVTDGKKTAQIVEEIAAALQERGEKT